MTRRRFIIRDSVVFLTLIAITIALFAVTLFLFRSFQSHRAALAQLWSERGLAAMRAGHPAQAIDSYRTALSYAPAERNDEMMLAEALGQAGRTEESYNYFTGLWDSRPGDGFINLQLARLAAKQRDVPGAENFYRASIYGTWEGDGVQRRRDARLELARYLIGQHQPGQAKTELLVAGGNAPEIPELEATLGGLLAQADDLADALAFYQKALRGQPRNQIALSGAGRAAFALGQYALAGRLLERAARELPEDEKSAALMKQAQRILQLTPSETLPARERVKRILAARTIAKKRLTACAAPAGLAQDSFSDLTRRWTALDANIGETTLLRDSDKQKALLQLIYDTEVAASRQCEAPAGDDALLLLLARSSSPEEGVSHP